ncbi:MAG: glycosyltransferase family 4 protein [Candidatus Dormibacteria bacterium]
MRVGLDLSVLGLPRQEQAGMARYARELALRLPLQDQGLRLALYSSRPIDLDGEDPRIRAAGVRVRPQVRGRLRALSERLPVELLAGTLDLAHAPAGEPPRTLRARSAYTIHDLRFLRDPGHYLDWVRRAMEAQARRAARECDLVLCDSEATRAEVLELLDPRPERLRVVHLGVGEEFRPVAAPTARALLPWAPATPFLLHVGLVEERKNLALLLRAYARALRRRPGLAPLVLAGNQGHQAEAVLLERRRLGLTDSVILPGFIPEAQLPALYSLAAGLVYPTLYEGFGLPALEAMACGCPVACSDRGALPEVVGDAALVLDASDEEGWAEAAERLSDDAAVRAQLRRDGLVRAAGFTWDRCARLTAAAYRDVAA